MTVNTANTLTVAVSDQDGDTVSVTLLSDLPGGATFKNKIYKWTPTSMDPVNISYVSMALLLTSAVLALTEVC